MSTTPEVPVAAQSRYEPVIGLEVHVQLLTRTKIFCGCSTQFGDPPNSNVCPVCLGLPGPLPVLNQRAVEFAVLAATALNCKVNETSIFARKNYFYPDLPKGYQISQYDKPLAEHGYIEIKSATGPKRIGITRVHLEEDAGKSLHDGLPDSGEWTSWRVLPASSFEIGNQARDWPQAARHPPRAPGRRRRQEPPRWPSRQRRMDLVEALAGVFFRDRKSSARLAPSGSASPACTWKKTPARASTMAFPTAANGPRGGSCRRLLP